MFCVGRIFETEEDCDFETDTERQKLFGEQQRVFSFFIGGKYRMIYTKSIIYHINAGTNLMILNEFSFLLKFVKIHEKTVILN